MTITVTRSGTQITGITWVSMDPFVASVKYKQHEIDGADYDVYHVTGKNSPTSTLVGVYRRTATNNATINSLAGSTATITHPTDGTHTALFLQPAVSTSSGGLFATVTFTLIEV